VFSHKENVPFFCDLLEHASILIQIQPLSIWNQSMMSGVLPNGEIGFEHVGLFVKEVRRLLEWSDWKKRSFF